MFSSTVIRDDVWFLTATSGTILHSAYGKLKKRDGMTTVAAFVLELSQAMGELKTSHR